MIVSERVTVAAQGLAGDANVVPRHPAEKAAWVWHPGCRADEPAVLRFCLAVATDRAADYLLHVSADQRFQLRIDGQEIGFGPDRCDLQHWSVATYRLSLPAGPHALEALVWFLGDLAPQAQVSLRGGFLLAASAVPGPDPQDPSAAKAAAHAAAHTAAIWNTGAAPWQVQRLDAAVAFTAHRITAYLDVGPGFDFHCAGWFSPPPARAAQVIELPIEANIHGVQRRHWRLHPTCLPEQQRETITGGRMRALLAGDCDGPVSDKPADPRLAPWQALLNGGPAVTVPPHTRINLLWDLGTYHCGYPDVQLSGGLGAQLSLEWAEALYQGQSAEAVRAAVRSHHKGARDEVEGKVFVGIGDRWTCDGESNRTLPALWWRSGRFVLVRINTGAQALSLQRLALRSTRYPLHNTSAFRSSDSELDASLPLLLRGLQMSAHETYVDCPYYEQLLYGGDGRLQFLSHYAVTADDALPRRCLELFDWSRWSTGMVAERYPSRDFQVSTTYAMLYPLMVCDHLMWRDDPGFIRERLPGVRCLLEHLMALAGPDGLLGRLPGWSFIDWVPQWNTGMGPGVVEGDSCIVNLQWVLCLQAAAALEEACGDELLAERCHRAAATAGAALTRRWWNAQRGLLADDSSHRHFSEHAQCLGLLAGVLDAPRAHACLRAWLAATDLARATVYFSFYPLEALYRAGQGAELIQRLDFWKKLRAQGFTTTVEMPEPSRSDCHGWGAHPLWHLQASVAGIRPAAPGFAKVAVAPQPGPLTHFSASCPHPQGDVKVQWQREDGGTWRAMVVLPQGTSGTWFFEGHPQELTAGANPIASPHALHLRAAANT